MWGRSNKSRLSFRLLPVSSISPEERVELLLLKILLLWQGLHHYFFTNLHSIQLYQPPENTLFPLLVLMPSSVTLDNSTGSPVKFLFQLFCWRINFTTSNKVAYQLTSASKYSFFNVSNDAIPKVLEIWETSSDFCSFGPTTHLLFFCDLGNDLDNLNTRWYWLKSVLRLFS